MLCKEHKFNKIRDLFKVKLYTKKREREKKEREKKKREREKNREREKKERERDFKYLLTLILTGGHK